MQYKEAFDLITEAYLENKLNPYEGCQCFIGNLYGGLTDNWIWARRPELWNIACVTLGVDTIRRLGPYTVEQVFAMEDNFLTIITRRTGGGNIFQGSLRYKHPDYENALFEAMESTLEMLKRIHLGMGEVIEEIPFFKRQLQVV